MKQSRIKIFICVMVPFLAFIVGCGRTKISQTEPGYG